MTAPTNPPLDELYQALDRELDELAQDDLLRTVTKVDAIDGVTATIRGRRVVLWCLNDYLGLSQHPRLIRAAIEAARTWGVGARASRLLAGSTILHHQLDERLASFFRAEAAATFPTGYLANLGALNALVSPHDVVFIDQLAHASLFDACRLSRARLRVFRHNDVEHVAKWLQRESPARRSMPRPGRAPARRRIIVTEGLFSMEGDRAPLKELLRVARRHGAVLYVDDAHGAFATGASGRGTPEVEGVAHGGMLYMATLGKALGCQGGFLVGPSTLVRLVQNRARTFIYETAAAPPVVAAAIEGLRVVEGQPSRRASLARNVERLHQGLGTQRSRTPTHIVPILLGTTQRARRLASELLARGIFAPAIRPPTVPEGTARLRLSLTALHTAEQIDQVVGALHQSEWVAS